MPNRNIQWRELAKSLLAHETASGPPPGDTEAAVFRICEKLHGSLSRLMGVAGFRSIFSRALALAGADVPWLRELQVEANGMLGGLSEVKTKLTDHQVEMGEVALVAELIDLLVTFIGPALTFRLLQDVWPNAELDSFEE